MASTLTRADDEAGVISWRDAADAADKRMAKRERIIAEALQVFATEVEKEERRTKKDKPRRR